MIAGFYFVRTRRFKKNYKYMKGLTLSGVKGTVSIATILIPSHLEAGISSVTLPLVAGVTLLSFFFTRFTGSPHLSEEQEESKWSFDAY